MKRPNRKLTLPHPTLYERPEIVRVAVRTVREHLQWQYGNSGVGVCSNHNHDSNKAGCEFPQ